MQAEDVVKIYKLLQGNGIDVLLDGGWGIDALLGEQTREHKDLDIAVRYKDEQKLRKLLSSQGFKEKKRDSEWNFVLTDEQGREVDVHVFELDEKGNHIYGIQYPAESLTGTGTINGQTVKCISAQWVVNFHANYEPGEKEIKDIRAICDKFGLQPPENYKIRS